MVCDLCDKLGKFERVNNQKFRKAVERGFDPFKLGIVNRSIWSVESFYGSSDPLANWSKHTVYVNDEDWNVCPNCMSRLKTYLV